MQRATCPKCKRVLRNINAWHYCKQVDIDDLFVNKPDGVILAFDKILSEVADWKDVEISATKNCVVFVRRITFLVIKPMRKCLEVKFFSDNPIDEIKLHKREKLNSKYQGIARFHNEQDIPANVINLIRHSYLIS